MSAWCLPYRRWAGVQSDGDLTPVQALIAKLPDMIAVVHNAVTRFASDNRR
jgi:hypothetical protein